MEAGKTIAQAVDSVLDEPANHTHDLGGSVNTDAFGLMVAETVTHIAQDP